MANPIVIATSTTRPAANIWDHLLEDENGVVVDTENYESIGQLAEGDLCDVHICSLNSENKGVMKITREKVDNDLVQNEAAVLKELYPETENDVRFYRYLPRLLHETTFEERQVNILPYFEKHVSLEAIHEAYPKGISHLDVAWMYKRLLVAIGFAHVRGYVHGAVLPPHFLVHPVNHGGKLIDWCCAVKKQERLRAFSAKYQEFYPPEVFGKRPVTSATDIYMAAKCVVYLLGGDVESGEMPDDVPYRIRDFIRSSLALSAESRPQDAWGLHESYDKLLRDVVGPRNYRLFQMPSSA